jgi:hypothetical protein
VTTGSAGAELAVRGEYTDGVDAVVRLTAGLHADDWDACACGEWSVTQVAWDVASPSRRRRRGAHAGRASVHP